MYLLEPAAGCFRPGQRRELRWLEQDCATGHERGYAVEHGATQWPVPRGEHSDELVRTGEEPQLLRHTGSTPGLHLAVGEEFLGVLAVVVDEVHRHGDLEARVTPGLASLLLHEADEVLLVVKDPVEEAKHVLGATIRTQVLPCRLRLP